MIKIVQKCWIAVGVMSFLTATNFIRLRGIEKFHTFHDMLNRGVPLKEIAAYLGVSVARAAQLSHAFFVREWTLRQEVADAIEFHLSVLDEEAQKNKTRYLKSLRRSRE